MQDYKVIVDGLSMQLQWENDEKTYYLCTGKTVGQVILDCLNTGTPDAKGLLDGLRVHGNLYIKQPGQKELTLIGQIAALNPQEAIQKAYAMEKAYELEVEALKEGRD
jgi:hypothetical protein